MTSCTCNLIIVISFSNWIQAFCYFLILTVFGFFPIKTILNSQRRDWVNSWYLGSKSQQRTEKINKLSASYLSWINSACIQQKCHTLFLFSPIIKIWHFNVDEIKKTVVNCDQITIWEIQSVIMLVLCQSRKKSVKTGK